MASLSTTNLINSAAGSQLQQDERSVDDAYNYNMQANDLSGLDMRAMQLFSSLLSVKMTLETNLIKLKADICKNIARNVVP
jgi:hypothetical protein